MPSVPQVVMRLVGGSYRSWPDSSIDAAFSSIALSAQDAALTYAGGGGGTIFMQDNMVPYSSVANAVSAGPFDSWDASGTAALTIDTTLDRNGVTKKCLRFDLSTNEDLAYLGYALPGAVIGTPNTGQKRLYFSYYEKRSSNYQFKAEKSSRVIGKNGDAATIDLITSYNGNGTDCTDCLVWGQAQINDSNYDEAAITWDRSQWYFMEHFYILNDPGMSNAEVYHWRNGTLVLSATGFQILETVASQDWLFQQVRFGGWESGAHGALGAIIGTETRWYDDFTVADYRVGA